MKDAKTMSMPLARHFKLSDKLSPTSNDENKVMEKIPYASIVGSLMYNTMYTRPNIVHATSVGIRYLIDL